MNPNRILTLLTDFGSRDVYVGVMKGVIAAIAPSVTVIDLTHEVPPQDVTAGRFCLMNAYPYFPDGTVHVAVVDPGVGSHRRAIAVQLSRGFFVAPDNGLLAGVLSQEPAIAAVELTNPDYWRTPTPSTTFHGRDIFAPVGAHIANGVPLDELGQAIDPSTLVQLDLPNYQRTDTGVVGCIQYCDRFGNLITNIPHSEVAIDPWSVLAGETVIPGGKTYSDAAIGRAIALVGSHGWLEIAVSGGSASTTLQLPVGAPIKVVLG